MIYGSVCSGIEAASVAWHPLGWKAAFLSEIEPFPRAVLKHHYPDTPLHGDFTTIKGNEYEPIELLVGGTPCQSFSVAGLRAGLNDPRGNLMLEFGALAKRTRPTWLVWENVAGVLSSNGGRDFGTFLGMLAELGYGFAYRIFDAQYVRVESHTRAVPQRRRRVFVVAYLGDWRRAAAVLFERESLSGHPPPSRKKGEGVAGTFKSRAKSGGWSHDVDLAAGGYMQPVTTNRMVAFGEYVDDGVASVMKQRDHKDATDLIAYGLAGNTIGRQPMNGGNGPGYSEDIGYTLTKTDVHAVCYPIDTMNHIARPDNHSMGDFVDNAPSFTITKGHSHAVAYGVGEQPDVGHCLRSGASKADKHESTTYVKQAMQVRRLTPRECHLLQGFPPDYLSQVHGASDTAMYRALGNSMAVNVMRHIGNRIEYINAL